MSNFGALIQEHFVQKFRANAARRAEKLKKITTRAAAEEYVRAAKKRLLETFDFPERTPLNPQITGKVKRPGYTIEKIIIESRPGFPVTMNFYLPDDIDGKIPAMMIVSGHAGDGKLHENYQPLCHTFAQNGCAALIVDPIHQGERMQLRDAGRHDLCDTHNIINRHLKSIGDYFGSWRVWDGIRAMDYLCSRPEIDTSRIGITGNSGGGTMTTLLSAVDSRYAAAAPGCYITSFLRNVENELPADGEQMYPGFAVDGGEMADLLIAAAPRPLTVLAQALDQFDPRGTKESFAEVRKIYELLGAEDNARLFVGPDRHCYSPLMRLESYRFFSEQLGLEPIRKEAAFELLTFEESRCTPTGNTLDLPGSKTVFDFIREKAEKISVPELSKEDLKKELRTLLGIGKIEQPYWRVLYHKSRNHIFSRYGLETDPGIVTTLFVTHVEHAWYQFPEFDKVELYVPHQSVIEELKDRPLPDEKEYYLCGIDYRGVGESLSQSCNQNGQDFFADYQADYHYDALLWMLNESMTGKRVKDVLSAVELLYAQGAKEVTLSASGIVVIPAVFAAFLSERPVKIKLPEKITTYREALADDFAPIPQSMIPAGILKLTDLDEIIKLLK